MWIKLDTDGNVFFRQLRVGKNNKDFYIYKFRTMRTGAEHGSKITIGNDDQRITNTGQFLRKYKLDELPQLYNIVKGDMSIVGPRPETRNYVSLYNPEQLKVLDVRPGLTDYASIIYINENEILKGSSNPHETYINKIMPSKLALNLKYIQDKSFTTDVWIIFKTLKKIVG